MEQHAIPQHISSYQFRLVGDMTLKQFFQIASGALISLLIYASGLHSLIKWPLIIFFFALGAALAFLPFQERPLSLWILSFFRSIYSPTVYLWGKAEKPIFYYKDEADVPTQEGIVAPHGKKALDDYLKKTPEEHSTFFSKLEEAEQSFLSRISKLFSSGAGLLKPTPPPSEPFVEKEKEKPKKKEEIVVPESKPVKVASKGFRPKIVVEEKPVEEEETEKPTTTTVSPILSDTDSQAVSSAQFSIDAAPPNPPTIPNTIVGQVMNPKGKIIEGAILEIKDVAGRPVRALRSNKVGHFMIVTSLQDGQYELSTEKEGYIYEPISFNAEGKLIPPIAIRAKAKVEAIIEEGSNNKVQNTNIKPN